MSAAPGTSREERQAAQLAANQAAAEEAERAASQPGGGVGQQTSQGGGPTWADTPAGRELRRQYEQSGVVFDSRGNIIYNPADLGAAEAELARDARGLPPSYKQSGAASPHYERRLAESGTFIKSLKSQSAKLRETRAEREEMQKNIGDAIASRKAELARLSKEGPTGSNLSELRSFEQQKMNLMREIDTYERQKQSIGRDITNIDTAIKQTARDQLKARAGQASAIIAAASTRTTTGPASIRTSTTRVAGPVSILDAPTSNRKQVQSGVKDGLFANPDYKTREELEAIEKANVQARRLAELTAEDPRAIPQRERVKAQTGVKDKLFANPAFMTEDQKLNAGFSQLAEAAGGKQFAVSLSEGKPSQPRQLTQEEVNALSPNEYAKYRAEYDAYNKYVSEYNRNIASLNLKAKEETKQQKKANLSQWKESKSQLLSSIDEAKKLGFTTFSIRDEKGMRDVPIDRAFKEIISSKGLKGAAPIPTIPEGYTVAGSLSSQVLVESPSKQLLAIEERKKIKEQIERDPTGLSSYIYREESLSDPIVGPYGPRSPSTQSRAAGSAYYSTLASGLAGIQNIGRAGAIFITEKIGGVKASIATQLGTPQLYQQKPTGFDIAFTAPLTAAEEAFNQQNATAFIPTLQQEVKAAARTVRDTPVPKVIGQAGGFFVLQGTPVPTKLLKVATLRYGGIPLYTAEGTVIAQKTLSVGFDKFNRPLIGKYGPSGEGKFFVGKPEMSKLGIEKIEAPTGSSFDRFQPSNLTPYQQSLFKPMMKYAEEKGLTRPGFVEDVEPKVIGEMKGSRKAPFQYEKQIPNQVLEPLPSGAPTYNIAESVGKAQKAKLVEPAKGSLVQRLLKGGLSRPIGDIDLEATSTKKGKKAVEQILKTDVGKGRALERQGFNIAIGETDELGKIKPGTTEKIVNIITEKEQIKNIGGISTETTYGMKYPKQKVRFDIPEKKTKFVTKSMGYQTQAKVTSITGIETRASLAGEGLSAQQIDDIVGPYKFVRAAKGRRYIKDVMDAYMGARETARVEFKAGNIGAAKRSAQTMVAIQKYYGRGFNFGEQIRSYRPSLELDFRQPQPKITDRISGGASVAGRGVPAGLTSIPRPQSSRESPSQKSIQSIRQQSISGRITSAYSPVSSRSALSGSPKSKSIYPLSARSISSNISSPRSTSTSSISRRSLFSPSPARRFTSSPKSPFTESPRPSPRSPLSPRSTSPGSPFTATSVKPVSPLSPSPILRPIKPLKPLNVKTPTTRRVPKLPVFVKQKTKKSKDKTKSGADFIGQAYVSQITGFAKRAEITYGRKRTLKLEEGDVRFTGKRYGRFTGTKSSSLLSKSRPTLTKPFKKEREIKL